MYFTTETTAQYYDCDCNNQLKLSAAMKYMQQTSSEQLEALGFSVEKLYGEHMVFLLSKMCVRVHRMPICNERLLVGTAATQPKGVRFVREFVIDAPNGERLLSALTLWVLVDPATRKILRPASFPYEMSFQQEALTETVKDIPFPKLPGGEKTHMSIPVRYSHTDVNRHINNTVYGDFVCDILPYEELITKGIHTLILSFQNEARYGEVVEIDSYQMEENAYHIKGLHNGGPCFESLAFLGAPED